MTNTSWFIVGFCYFWDGKYHRCTVGFTPRGVTFRTVLTSSWGYSRLISTFSTFLSLPALQRDLHLSDSSDRKEQDHRGIYRGLEQNLTVIYRYSWLFLVKKE